MRELSQAGDHQGAATLCIRSYGSEVLSFVRDRLRAGTHAEDVFSDALENLWQSFPTFRWDCTARTWFYLIARRSIARHHRRQNPLRALAATDTGALAQLAAEVHSRTAPFMQTEVKTRARILREQLPEEDQTLLILRIDRGLSFSELARVLSDDDTLSDDALKTESARLRKRFQLAKQRLSDMLVKEGLVR